MVKNCQGSGNPQHFFLLSFFMSAVDLSIPVEKKAKEQNFSQLYPTSEAYYRLLTLVARVNKLLGGTTLPVSTQNVTLQPSLQQVIVLLSTCNKLIEECPPLKTAQRFGNKAFATWHEKLTEV